MKVTLGSAQKPEGITLSKAPDGSVAYDAGGNVWIVVQGFASCLTRLEVSGPVLNSTHVVTLYPKGTLLTIEVD